MFDKRSAWLVLILAFVVSSKKANCSADRFSKLSLGRCFDSSKDFVRYQFHSLPMESNCTTHETETPMCSSPDSVDHNIQIVTRENDATIGETWVIDKTPGNWPNRYLLRKDTDSNTKVCLLLFVPSSSEFSLIKSDVHGSPLIYRAGVSPRQGMPGWKVDFRLNQTLKVFEPTNCKRIDADTSGAVTKISTVHCDSTYK